MQTYRVNFQIMLFHQLPIKLPPQCMTLYMIKIYSCIQLWYSSFLTSCSCALNHKWVPIFLVHSIKTRMFNHSTRVFNHTTRMFKFVFDCHGFTSMCSSSNLSSMHCKYVTSSDSLLCVHTSLLHVLFELCSSNSQIKIGNHIRKGRGLILLVTRPAKINHLSTNYTEFYLC